MKIKSMSDQILVIIDNNTFGIIIGIIFVFFGSIMLKPEIVNVKQDVPVLMVIIFILLGVLTIIIPTHDLVIFDKKNNLLTVKHKSIIPFLRSSEKCNLAQIKKIKLLIIPQGTASHDAPFYKIVCVLDDGKEISLNPTKSSFSYARIGQLQSTQVPARDIGQTIATFLRIPFEEEARSRYSTDFFQQHKSPF